MTDKDLTFYSDKLLDEIRMTDTLKFDCDSILQSGIDWYLTPNYMIIARYCTRRKSV